MSRILVAEDNPVNQTVARELLKKLGHQVDVVENGARAVDAVAAGSYDIVLMDLHMPLMDGLEAARKICARQGPHPRIIAVTANVTPGTREECIAAGMDDYMSKPVTMDRLREMLERWMPGTGSTPAAAPPPTGQDQNALVLHLRSLAADTDPDFVRELIGIFRESGTDLLRDMATAHEASDWKTLERTAHSLKGASNNIGATDLAGLCLSLEKAAAEGGGTAEQIAEIRGAFVRIDEELRTFQEIGPP
jgi:CheY-like chemotaxis protein/HPt (histidine-containing phosphotransfer) domain-containing protein